MEKRKGLISEIIEHRKACSQIKKLDTLARMVIIMKANEARKTGIFISIKV